MIMRKSRKVKDEAKRTRGKTISVQFFTDEDDLVRDLARRDGDRSVADTVRVLALAEARRRQGATVAA